MQRAKDDLGQAIDKLKNKEKLGGDVLWARLKDVLLVQMGMPPQDAELLLRSVAPSLGMDYDQMETPPGPPPPGIFDRIGGAIGSAVGTTDQWGGGMPQLAPGGTYWHP